MSFETSNEDEFDMKVENGKSKMENPRVLRHMHSSGDRLGQKCQFEIFYEAISKDLIISDFSH